MERKKNGLILVIAISALFVIAGVLYIWTFSTYLNGITEFVGSDHVVLSPFDTEQGVQFSPQCEKACPYSSDILCELIWKC